MGVLLIWLCKPPVDCSVVSVALGPLKLTLPSAAGFISNFTLLTCIIAALIINFKAHLILSSLGLELPTLKKKPKRDGKKLLQFKARCVLFKSKHEH